MLAKEPEGFSGIFRRMGYTALLPLLRLPSRIVVRDLPTALTDVGVSSGDVAQISLSRLVVFALSSAPESWANLAVEWLAQGFPINSDIFMAGEALLQSPRGSQRARGDLTHTLARWKKSRRHPPGAGGPTRTCTTVYLISNPLLVSLRSRFGGITSPAAEALTPRPGYGLVGSVKLSLFPLDDSACAHAVLNTLSGASTQAGADDSDVADAVQRLLSFYSPLCPGIGVDIDDSAGSAKAIGPVLAPERCRGLLDLWTSAETRVLEKQLDCYPIFFDWAERPNERFHTARQLLGLLGRYAAFLRQAVGRDYFYFSYYSTSL
jgi:hypothetical protein